MDQFTKDSLIRSEAFESVLMQVAPTCAKCNAKLTVVTDDRIDSESNTIPFYYTCDHYTLPLSWPDIEFILSNGRLPRDFLVRAFQLDGENDPEATACLRAGTAVSSVNLDSIRDSILAVTENPSVHIDAIRSKHTENSMDIKITATTLRPTDQIDMKLVMVGDSTIITGDLDGIIKGDDDATVRSSDPGETHEEGSRGGQDGAPGIRPEGRSGQ